MTTVQRACDTRPPTMSPQDTHAPETSARILLVDDDPISRTGLATPLKRLGHEVLEAADGCEGLEVARREHPDLIIVDWMMPQVDGPTLCETIRKDPTLRTMHIILMTAHDQPAQIAEGLARGADDFLSKAASPQEIMARVGAGLRTHTLVRELESARDHLSHSYQLLASQQQVLESELRSAARFVTTLLPPAGKLSPGLDLAWQFLPSQALGGDLFNATPWGATDLGIYILDASGHGVAAALRAASLMTFLRADSLLRQVGSYEPGAIVTEVNRRFPLTSDGDYFTLWVGCLHLSTRELRFCAAGHAGAILFRGEGMSHSLAEPTLPIGFQPDTSYMTRSVTLTPGDRLFVFSDGLYETRSPAGDIWGLQRLQAAMGTLHTRPLNEVIEQTMRYALTWQQQEGFKDDAALLGLEVIH